MRNNKKIYIPDYMIVLKQLSREVPKKISQLVDETHITYNHLFQIKKEFIKEKLININIIGQTHNITLTEKGEVINHIVFRLIDKLGFTDESIKQIRQSMKHKEHKKSIESTNLNSGTTLNNNIEVEQSLEMEDGTLEEMEGK